MRLSAKYRAIAICVLVFTGFNAYAQTQIPDSIKLDTLTKLIGVFSILLGGFIGYMQLKMANKIAEVEARFTTALAELKEEFHEKLEKSELKFEIIVKEIEKRMATHHDMNNMKQVMGLQYENLKELLKNR